MKWKRERKQFFKDRGIKIQKWERQRMEGDRKYKELEERKKVRQREKRWKRIRKSRFSR